MKRALSFSTVGRGLLAAGVILALAACASTKLQLDLALYSGDPSYGLKSTDDIPALIERATVVLNDAKALQDDAIIRSTAAERLYDAFATVYTARLAAARISDPQERTDKELQNLRNYKAKYVESLTPLTTQLPVLTDRLSAAIASLQENAMAVQEDPANAAKADALRASRSKLQLSFVAVQVLLESVNFEPGSSYVQEWRTRFEPFRKRLEAEAKRNNNPEVRSAIAAALGTLNGNPGTSAEPLPVTNPDVGTLGSALGAVATMLEAKNADAAHRTEEVAGLSVFHSALEFQNLQDAADPRWRVVRDPRNEDKWVDLKSQTYFYSEGKNSVVVVRDRPDDFRVQNASNNPTALIQSQLEISRAVTNAAIEIGGAAMGVPKLATMIPAKPSAGASVPTATDDSTAAINQAADAARIAEETRTRNAVVADLRVRLRQIQTELDAAGSDQTKLGPIADEFYALMEGAKTLLPAPPADATQGTDLPPSPPPAAPSPILTPGAGQSGGAPAATGTTSSGSGTATSSTGSTSVHQ